MKKDELEDFHKRDDVGEWKVFLSKIAIFCGENDLLRAKYRGLISEG